MAPPATSVATLKAEGVALFKKRRYPAAVKKFTAAIELDEPDSDELKAQCYNNRAAAREFTTSNVNVLIEDLDEAILLKPDYGAAYARRHRYHRECRMWLEALADLYCARHLGEHIAAASENECVVEFAKRRRNKWIREVIAAGDKRFVPIKHEWMFRWRYNACGHDLLINHLHAHKKGGLRNEGVYSHVLGMLNARLYDKIEECIFESQDDLGVRAPECWLVAALICAAKNKHDKSRECFSRATDLIADLPEKRRRGLRVSAHVVAFARAKTEADLMVAFLEAVKEFPDVPDMYMQAYSNMEFFSARAASAVLAHPGADCMGELRHLIEYKFAATDGLKEIEEYEEKLRAVGFPPYIAVKLAYLYADEDEHVRGRKIAWELADRENESSLWYTLRMMSSPAIPQQEMEALRRCLACEPYNIHANSNTVFNGIKVYRMTNKVPKRSVLEFLWEHSERSLACYAPPVLKSWEQSFQFVMENNAIVTALILAASHLNME